MCEVGSSKRPRHYTFQKEWEEEYCFMEIKRNAVCLLCNRIVKLKKYNVERHFKLGHKDFDKKFMHGSDNRKEKINSLKISTQLIWSKKQQEMSENVPNIFQKEHTTELTWPEPDEASFESPIVLKEDNSSEVPPFTSESQYNRSVSSKRSLQSSLDYESLSTEVLLTLKNQLNHQDDRFDIFAKNIAMKLRELPYQQRLLAEKIINDTLFEAEMGNLTMSHSIMPTSQHQHLTSRMSTSSRPILHQKRSMQQQIHSQHSATTTDISKDSTSLFISKASGTPAKTNNSQKSDAEHQESRRIAFKRTVSDSQDESNESSRDNTDYPTDIKSRNSLLSAPTSMPFEFVSALPIKVEPEEGDDYLEQQTSSNSQNYYSYPS